MKGNTYCKTVHFKQPIKIYYAVLETWKNPYIWPTYKLNKEGKISRFCLFLNLQDEPSIYISGETRWGNLQFYGSL